MRRAFAALMALSALAGCGPRYASSSASPFRQPKSIQLLIRRTDAVPSQEIKDRYAGRHFDGDYAIKADKDGRVIEAHPLRSIPELDELVVSYLRHWQMADPPSVMRVEVIFALPATATGDGPAKYRALPEMAFDHLVVARVAPPLQHGIVGSGYYMVYVEPDGGVSRVDVISSTGNADDMAKATFLRWKFKATGERIRGPLRLAVEFPH